MGFSNTVVKTGEIGPGLVYETGTWSAASATTGTITPGTATSGSPTFNLKNIIAWSFTSDGATPGTPTAILPTRYGVYANQIKITCQNNDTGTYTLIGEGA